MGASRALVSAILGLLVVLTLAKATYCFSVHHPQRTFGSSLQHTLAKTRQAQSILKQRFIDLEHVFQRRSAEGPKQIAHREGSIETTSKLFEREDLGEFQGVELGRKGGFRLPVDLQEQLGVSVTVPVAKPWPEEFTVEFTTKSGASSGLIAYDWAQKRQVVYHGTNSTFCSAYGTQDACQMFEFPGGTYVYIPSLEKCFLSVEGVGSLPPEWTTNSEYVGVEEVPGIGLCRSFAFPPTAHVWYETVVGSLPCVFVFPEPTMSYYFDPSSLKLGTPDEKYFDFPSSCFVEGRYSD